MIDWAQLYLWIGVAVGCGFGLGVIAGVRLTLWWQARERDLARSAAWLARR